MLNMKLLGRKKENLQRMFMVGSGEDWLEYGEMRANNLLLEQQKEEES